MNKKVQKGLVAAVAATMGASIAAPAVQAATSTLDQMYAEAYNAVSNAKTQKELTAARVLIEKVYPELVKANLKNLGDTLGTMFDAKQTPLMVDAYKAIETAQKSVKQADLNTARALVADMPAFLANAYSDALDKVQQAIMANVDTLIKKAQASKLQADYDAAKVALDELLTTTNPEVKKFAEEYFKVELGKVVVVAPIKVDTISSITPNTATVVLTEAPTVELTAKDFAVAGNTVTKVEKGNYDTVYTLTLGTSLDNKKGALTINGAVKDYDFTQLKLTSVNAKNLRQLEVKFSKTIDVSSVPQNADGTYTMNSLLDNLHIWMTAEETGAIATHSFASILGTNATNWRVYVQEDKQTLIIESVDGSLITSNAAAGLGLKLNETYEVESINVLDETGKYSDVSYVSQILKDTVRPVVASSTQVVTTVNELELTFSEPVKNFVSGSAYAGKAKIYVDGTEVPVAAIKTDINATTTVDAHRTVVIDTTQLGFALSKGDHNVAVVGAEDINGNLISNNGAQLLFKVVDPADAQTVEPVVNNIVQIADNAFKVVFNTPGVTEKAAGDVITIKNGAYNPTTKVYEDIKIADTAVVKNEIPATSTVPAHTEWVVVVNATATEAAGELSYKGANVMTRNIEVKNFKNSNKDGKLVTRSLTLNKDITAPVVATDGLSASADTLKVKFSDSPFAIDGNGKIEYVTGKVVTVKYVDKDGVTYSEEVTPVLAADGVTLELKVTNTNMLDNKGKLFAGENYTMVLPDALVKDAKETVGTAVYDLLDGQHPFVGKTVSYKIPGVVNVGLVPQTTRGLIFTGYEKAKSIGTYAASTTLTLKDNQVVVVFEGEVDAKTAVVSSNYTLNGKVLPQGSTIEYRQADIAGNTDLENFVIITLADNTVALTGGQDFTVAGVANKSGNKMMPVADVITLSDNTQAVAKALEIRDSNKLVITFSEAINLTTTDMTQLARNFEITVNGKTVSLLSATVEDRTKLVITTADNFDNNGSLNVPASVKIKVDADGNMFIEDIAANKAKSMTINK